MDFLTKTVEQLKDLFRQMTPAARITTGLLIVVVVISLVYLFRMQTSGSNDYLLGGAEFTQAELAAMAAAFASDGLEEGRIVGSRMQIPQNQQASYLKALKDHDAMPRDYGQFQVGSSSPFESSKARDSKEKFQKQLKLSKVVTDLKGIEKATVEYSESPGTGFPKRTIQSALVAVKPEGQRDLEKYEVVAIQQAIATAEAGLLASNVAVLDMNNNITHVGPYDGLPGAGQNIYAQHKLQYENLWKKKIEETLTHYDGVVVGVNVQLTDELRHQESQKKYDTKPVTVNSVEFIRTSNSADRERGGRPGTRSNSGNSNQAAVIVETTTDGGLTEESENRNDSPPSTTETVTEKVGLIPKQVSATIGIPSSFYEKVWRKSHPTPEGESRPKPDADEVAEIERATIASVKESVKTLLMGASPTEEPTVTVRTDQDDLPVEMMPKPTLAETAVAWVGGHWQTLALMLFAGVGLIMVRRTIRSTTTPQTPAAQANVAVAPPANTSEQDEMEVETQPKLKRKFGSAGPDLRDELKDLVNEDPDAAANVLRNWIGDAA